MIEVGETIADLQSEIRRRRSALDRLSGDDSGYEAALAELMKSTDALLEYEDQIPAISTPVMPRSTMQVMRTGTRQAPGFSATAPKCAAGSALFSGRNCRLAGRARDQSR
jgi:hypothetical protein